MHAWLRMVVAVLVALGALDASAQSVLEGEVVGITDGDTLTLLVDQPAQDSPGPDRHTRTSTAVEYQSFTSAGRKGIS